MRAPRQRTAVELRAGTVTRVVPSGSRSDRVVLYIDGTKAFELNVDVVTEAGVRRGDHLETEAQARLLERDAPHRARDRALAMLAARERCRREVESRLHDAGFAEDVIAGTLSWLVERGYVDDLRCASSFAEVRRRAGWGEPRIRADLVRRGVGRDTIDQALVESEAAEKGGDEGRSRVEALARRRFLAQFASDPVTAQRRLSGFLARRGYDWDTVSEVTRKLRAEAEANDGAGEPGAEGLDTDSR